MKIFSCQNCSQTVLFENTSCENCGSLLGFIPEQMQLSALQADTFGYIASADLSNPKKVWRYCENHQHQVCNWLVEGEDAFCMACDLNRHIPNLSDIEQHQAWQQLEFAKHRLVYSILQLELPLISKKEDLKDGLSFDFISEDNVVPDDAQASTGHALGQVTINASEANSAEREQTREDMQESYRTLIGHFRHEVGHYYWDQLVATDEETLDWYRQVFGDEREDYSEALQRHYEMPLVNWREQFISAYASSHPWEDWAETWAHYLHILDTLETANQFGVSIQPPNPDHQTLCVAVTIDPYQHGNFDDILAQYLPLTFAVNSLNRSMGQPDLYPFVIVPAVRQKLHFIHHLLQPND